MSEQYPDRAQHERAQLHRWSQLTHAQRLAWLWKAKMFARRAVDAAQRRALGEAVRPGVPSSSEGDGDATSGPTPTSG